MRALLAASETKQNRELAFRVTQLMRATSTSSAAPILLRVEQAIGNTGVEMAKQRASS